MINEDEDAEGLSDSRSVDLLAQGSVSWVKGNKRTQILPEGEYPKSHILKTSLEKFLHLSYTYRVIMLCHCAGGQITLSMSGGHVRVENVVDWPSVVQQFLSQHRQRERSPPERETNE